LGEKEGEKKATEKFNADLKNLQASTEKTLESLALQQKKILRKLKIMPQK